MFVFDLIQKFKFSMKKKKKRHVQIIRVVVGEYGGGDIQVPQGETKQQVRKKKNQVSGGKREGGEGGSHLHERQMLGQMWV